MNNSNIVVREYVPLSKLSYVRSHSSIEEFAGIMVSLRATDPAGALTATQIGKTTEIDPRGIYNRLSRPGFVTINNGEGNANTYYYLYNDGFGELARQQGHKYYPEHLAPLVTYLPKIPMHVDNRFIARIKDNVDVVGTVKSADDVPDSLPLLVRALGFDDAQLVNDKSISATVTAVMQDIFDNPFDHETKLDNVLVILSGIKRWIQQIRESDKEKREYILEQFNGR